MAESGPAAPTVCVVLVTYNRRELLEQALDRLAAQTRRPDAVLVVDNASTDGTAELLASRDEVEVLRLDVNAGGAGGFAGGVDHAARRGHEWLWLMDDDTLPEPGCLEALLDGVARAPERPSLMTSVVRWKDGTLHPMNRPWPRFNARRSFAEGLRVGLVPVRHASFVSTMIRREAIDRHGLPRAHYFIWHDDTELTRRMLKDETGYLVPESVAFHWTANPGNVVTDDRGRFYFKVRNHLWMVRGDAFRGLDKINGVVSLVRAIVTYVRSSDRRLRAAATVARGLRDGVGPEPR